MAAKGASFGMSDRELDGQDLSLGLESCAEHCKTLFHLCRKKLHIEKNILCFKKGRKSLQFGK